VFEEYRAQLNEQGKKEYVDLLRDARQLIEEQGLKLSYRNVVVDEAQDMSAEAFRLLRAMVPEGADDLFIVGDAHQRIYRHRASLGQCGIDIRGRGRKLKINYRTTDEIRRFAVGLLQGRQIDDLDGGIDDQKGYVSLTHGAPPDVHTFPSMADELEFLRGHIDRLHKQGVPLESICLVARTHRILDSYVAALNDNDIATYEIRRNMAERRDRTGLRVATMHRVKGLEFDHMIVVSANAGVLPLEQSIGEAEDVVASRNLETAERSLLYVALTRAKKSAVVTSWGALSPFLSV
jgi:superfamily I DNA/RNA helicase